MNQKEKANFRKTKAWLKKKEEVKKRQGGLDIITGKKLLKGWNCHHLDLNNDNYAILDEDDKIRFVGLNKQTHEFLHWAMRYANQPQFIDNLVVVLEMMKSFVN